MIEKTLSENTRKCLANQLGDAAAREITDMIESMADEIRRLRQTKVDVTPIIRSEAA